MHVLERIGNGIGLLALAASFALASPGVKVVRADTVASQAPPVHCEAAAERAHSKDAQLEAFLHQLRREHVRSAPEARPEVVVLNNRGFNYEQARPIELDAILAEIEERR